MSAKMSISSWMTKKKYKGTLSLKESNKLHMHGTFLQTHRYKTTKNGKQKKEINLTILEKEPVETQSCNLVKNCIYQK